MACANAVDRVRRAFEHAYEQRQRVFVILADLVRGFLDSLHDLVMSDQLMINFVLHIDDSHA